MNMAKPDNQNLARMPALFIGHGSPLNAIEDNEFSRAWAALGQTLPRPKAVLCISAHWQTEGARITAMPQPRTIHDFYGFPKALFDFVYPAPGSPVLAMRIHELMPSIVLDQDWGLDHGSWSILCHMFPEADVPVMQLSLDLNKSPEQHYQLGKALGWLRDEGVLIVGSGNIVHNLQAAIWRDTAHDWAVAFAERIKQLLIDGDHRALVRYRELGDAALAIPTDEHFLPLLYILGLRDEGESLGFFTDKTTLGAISMLSVQVG
ncbi:MULTISPECIES: 4,5-DOPA dioxygenase extradiol [Methylomonas]|uniref:Dioxygenase n=2 Tax=Methylomonas TaxID=416 RepID=A0A126T6J0_9GAMM|nr:MULTISPECIES: 4,5-DOPA dioxygenase extradiol [Methylomonas]AMK77660.1 dioxygenase [Methylomonas denitrificans]OAH96845.1 dioxygenase [Methylomonas methanica]TCV86830.1 4,5-DOPA dioxygenase extradiol [Methylomonas methanica]